MSGSERDDDLFAVADAVVDEESFLSFLKVMARDFARERELEADAPSPPYGPGKLGWKNGSVDAVLECAAAWGSTTKEATSQKSPQHLEAMRPDFVHGQGIRVVQSRLGIDVGGVIIDRTNQGADTSFLTGDYLRTPAVKDAINAIKTLVERFHPENVLVVSKCGETLSGRL